MACSCRPNRLAKRFLSSIRPTSPIGLRERTRDFDEEFVSNADMRGLTRAGKPKNFSLDSRDGIKGAA